MTYYEPPQGKIWWDEQCMAIDLLRTVPQQNNVNPELFRAQRNDNILPKKVIWNKIL